MDQACKDARTVLESYFEILQKIHPDILSVGTPAYMSPNRICFSLKLKNGKRRSVQYARLLIECKLRRALTVHETVDHIDFNTMNNNLDNLQVLSRKDNAKKGGSIESKINSSKLTSIRMQGNKLGLGSRNGMSKLTDEEVIEIKQLQKIYYRGQDKVLALKYRVSRELISLIRRNKIRVSDTN